MLPPLAIIVAGWLANSEHHFAPLDPLSRGEVRAATARVDSLPGGVAPDLLKSLVSMPHSAFKLTAIYVVSRLDFRPFFSSDEVRSSAALYLFTLGAKSGSLAPLIVADILAFPYRDEPLVEHTEYWGEYVSLSHGHGEKLSRERLLWSIGEERVLRLLVERWYLESKSGRQENVIAITGAILECLGEHEAIPYNKELLVRAALNHGTPYLIHLAATIAVSSGPKFLNSGIKPDVICTLLNDEGVMMPGRPYIYRAPKYKDIIISSAVPLILDEEIGDAIRVDLLKLVREINPVTAAAVSQRLLTNGGKKLVERSHP